VKDNRIHYAVNCASIGCPALMPAPYSAENFFTMLDQGARVYVNHPRGARLQNGDLTVSSIYRWYKEDFGGDWQGVLAHLRQYANANTAQMLAPFTTVGADSYDWRLNDAGNIGAFVQPGARGPTALAPGSRLN
jgi:hypothetical protein